MRTTRSTLAVVLTLAFFASFVFQPSYAQPGPASDRITYTAVPTDLAAAALRAGDIDVYEFQLESDIAAEIGLDDPDIDMYQAVSGMNDIFFNTAPTRDTSELNPLSIREVRYALQFAVDWEFMVDEIFRGFALVMSTYEGPQHPDIGLIMPTIFKHNFHYDLAKANTMIEAAMGAAGAVKTAGKWSYQGEPIVLNAWVRVEDERRDIGDTFVAFLKRLGFEVNTIHSTFGPAIDTIYGTDPQDFEWHIYTEGWGIGGSRYLTWQPGEWGCTATWPGACPGAGGDYDWTYFRSTPELERLDDLSDALIFGDYADMEERTALISEATDIQMYMSLRLFGVRTAAGYPARRDVQGLSDDTAMGFRSIWDQREAFVPGSDTVKYASLWVWTETTVWNPIRGFNDVYSVDLARATSDPMLWRHPFTQEVIEFRGIVEDVTTTFGTDERVEVPADAVKWNADTDRWEAVGSGMEAKSVVTFDGSLFCQSTWHHGIQIALADVAAWLAVTWDIAYDEVKSARETEIAALLRGTYDRVVAYEFLPPCRGKVYHDFTHFDDMEVAFFETGLPSLAVPTELLFAMDRLVFEDQTYAYALTAANIFGVPWLSLVLTDHASDTAVALQEMSDEQFYPENVFTVNGGQVLATQQDMLDRYTAALTWSQDKGIMWISNGPFYLNAFDSAAQFAELLAFREENYPFSKGDWFFGRVTLPEVQYVDVPILQSGVAGAIEVGIEGPQPLLGEYLILDARTGDLILQGDLTSTADPTVFDVDLSSADMALLGPGTYTLVLIGGSEQLARRSVFTTRFRVIPAVGPGGPPITPGDIPPGGVVSGETFQGAVFAGETYDTTFPTVFSDQTTLVLGLGIVGLIIGIAVALALKRSE